ncbi:hypothetical protein [Bacillus sp. FJAT-22090]|uniref:hypothetical protein n=1 Tax=Bacillus sp. FJAT-22090 TaxID=1581038 RepID=UPI0011A728AB|nr:hypothetical protein [Bacillus sp. FJAT-22090]
MSGMKLDLNSKDLFYRDLTISDVNVVRLLIEFRYKYDNYLYSVSNNAFDVAGEVQGVNTEMLLTYAALDETIKECNLSEEQMKIIELYEHGLTHQEIAIELGMGSKENIKKRINTICKEVVKQNLWNWRKVNYKNTLDLKMKKCSKCKDELPATDEFYYSKNDSEDGFHSQCKSCFKEK